MTPEQLDTIEKQEISDIMKTQGGRNFIARVLGYTNLEEDIYNPDPIEHALNAGRREVGVWLRDTIIDADPDLYVRLIKERING